MWVAKFKIKHDDWILDKTVKYNITARGIPLNSYTRKGKQYHTGFVFLSGTEQNKKKFIASVQRDRRIKRSKVRGDSLFVLIQSEDSIARVFDRYLFFVQPVFFKEGFEYWELGSWEKKPLVDFYERTKKRATVKMLKLKQEFPSVFIQHAMSQLTAKQQMALELALEHGYFQYPRKVSVLQLAKITKIPRTTLQEHLRKAEEKIMRLLIGTLR